MKQIKHILVVIAAFFSLYLFVGMLAPGQLSAQTKQQLLVAVTPYRPLQNLDFFFTHSVHPLMYLEQPGQTPVFLSIITLAQRAQYVQAGYQPVIVDQQAVDMNRYYLLFSRKKKGDTHTPITIAMDSSLKQQGVKLVYPLNKEMVLAKFAPGQSLGQVAARNSQFASLKGFEFHWDLVPPVDRTSKALQQKYTHPSVTTKPATPQSLNSTALRSWPVASIILLAILAFIYYCLSRK